MSQKTDSLTVPKSPRSRHRTKPCPFCAETIRYEAIKCRFCGEFLPRNRRQADANAGPAEPGPAAAGPHQDSQDEDGGKVLWFGRPSLLALASPAVKTACFVVLCWAVYRYTVTALVTLVPGANVSIERLAQIEGWLNRGAVGLGIAAILVLTWRALALKSICYEVSPDRIEWSRGIFDRHVDNIDMFRVIDLKLRRSLIECLLGIGTVVLATKDQSDPHFEFVKVRRCRRLYDIIKEANLKADKKRGVIHLE